MRVITYRSLREFWATHPDAESSLRAWYKPTRIADWTKFADVKASFGSASLVGDCVVFNVGGNKYRLVTRLRYPARKVFILRLMTHAEYDDQARWQAECGCHSPPPSRPTRAPSSPRK